MFTQCPQCETIFRLTADTLGAAGGQVRCGRCGEVFDALKRLAEQPHMFVIGESTLELEARAEKILESADPPPAAGDADAGAGAGPDFAIPEIGDLRIEEPPGGAPASRPALPEHLLEADSSLEFTLAPAELDRIFIEASPGDSFPDDDDASLERIRADLRAIDAGPEPDTSGTGAWHSDGSTDDSVDESAIAHSAEYDVERDAELDAGHDPEHDAEPGPAAEATPEQMLAPVPDPERRLRLLLTGAALLLVVALAAQVVHRNREYLASRPPFGPALRSLYANLGKPLPVPASLTGYQLRQWGASGDAGASGALRVRASILNTTGQMQPFPLLRVTLADRFGAHLGSREFEPADYLGRPVTRLLAPGERADATIDIQDPGKNAEGFELDVCLRSADGKVRCAGDPATHPP